MQAYRHVERWCIDANRVVVATLDDYWSGVREKVEEEIRVEGEPVLMYDPSPNGAKRRIRWVPQEELAQALIDGALTPEGVEDANEGIRELGFDPEDFTPRF